MNSIDSATVYCRLESIWLVIEYRDSLFTFSMKCVASARHHSLIMLPLPKGGLVVKEADQTHLYTYPALKFSEKLSLA